MPINDIWRNFSNQIGFYTRDNSNLIPSHAGTYAWFLPLRPNSKDLNDLIKEVHFIMNYDGIQSGKPEFDSEIKMNWDVLRQKITFEPKEYDIKNIKDIWDKFAENESTYSELQKALLSASIFLPPLYVGKTNNLAVRYGQHTSGRHPSQFCQRFENYAIKTKYRYKKVEDLLFVTIRSPEIDGQSKDSEVLIEELLKIFSKPQYSLK